MSEFSKIEPSYISKEGCRLIWKGIDDEYSRIIVNTDTTQFQLKDHKALEAKTSILRKSILEYRKVPHEPKPIKIYPKEFYPSIVIEKEDEIDRNELLAEILTSKSKTAPAENELFRVMSTRRSTRNFDTSNPVEQWKIDKILAAADTAPTAGNFQSFEIVYVKNKEIKKRLVEAANNQPYVNAPVVLVFCMNPARIKMKFPSEILTKFSLQDATLAAAYSQLAASALGLSSIWIGMIDEEKVKEIIETDFRPSSVLCIGYPNHKRPPKSRRKLKELIRVIE
jgi:nitroreductase